MGKGVRKLHCKIGPYYYLIRFDSVTLALRDRDRGSATHGETVFEKSEIHIQENMDPIFERETVLHEINHIIMYVCGLHDDQPLQSMNNEQIVSVTTTLWLQVLREPENKEMLEYLSGEV